MKNFSEIRLDPAIHSWIKDYFAQEIIKAIKEADGEARFVGGAVRDALLGKEVGDVDIAVTLPPEKVIKALKNTGIKTIPTGIAHGTITAIVGNRTYEITTLRKDVETYGRHAKVSFDSDWKSDAARRDFTINALYADENGKIFDYFGGLEDLKKGKIRFIGDPEKRIREDVLRILRFFRFYAWYGKGDIDSDAFQCCRKLAPLLAKLSAERIWKELKRLLLAPDPSFAVQEMVKARILQRLFPCRGNADYLRRMVSMENKYGIAPHCLPRLATLLRARKQNVIQAAKKLKLSKQESKELNSIIDIANDLKGKAKQNLLRVALYRNSKELVKYGVLLFVSRGGKIDLAKALKFIAQWEIPSFPITGEDILGFGVKPGPRIGKLLSAVENWWLKNDLKLGRTACLRKLRKLVIKSRSKNNRLRNRRKREKSKSRNNTKAN